MSIFSSQRAALLSDHQSDKKAISPPGTSISVQARGKQILVNRNFSNLYYSRVKSSNDRRLKTICIYALPINIRAMPAYEDPKYHRCDGPHKLNLEEFEMVSSRFIAISAKRRLQYVRSLLNDEDINGSVSSNPENTTLSPIAKKIHAVVSILDYVELLPDDLIRSLHVVEIEQLYQATWRLKRRLQQTGVRERDVDYALYKKYDDDILLASSSVAESGVQKGDCLYRKRSREDIESGRKTTPSIRPDID